MSNKFLKGMFLGALAGGALSLLDRETRQVMKGNCQKATNIIKNPRRISEQVKEAALKFKATVEQVSEDLSYISEKVEELREATPQVTKLLKETKEVFSKKEEVTKQEIDIDQEEWAL
ncbi:YtxH domain-containing protein [Neobacillus sp. PS3-40]|uniref:YtxH domain-containing protein n=1 Tax=Neobacillus sp. PS3-40 TaxID=3070679 RepID=UPI0027DFCCCF|nr:YtxH domain-containing protein [Neobacillus sp. PS3-40]WML42970.1 YtxH domain-containing protein [Neobacillus sp. PS3-40]